MDVMRDIERGGQMVYMTFLEELLAFNSTYKR